MIDSYRAIGGLWDSACEEKCYIAPKYMNQFFVNAQGMSKWLWQKGKGYTFLISDGFEGLE